MQRSHLNHILNFLLRISKDTTLKQMSEFGKEDSSDNNDHRDLIHS